MQQIIESDLLWLVATIGIYSLGTALYQRTKIALLHPLLLTFLSLIALLNLADFEYEKYREATKILDLALGMSVVSLGYLLYEQLEKIKRHILPLLVSTIVGSLVGVLSVVYIAKAFGAERIIITSLAPKSVTVPIAAAIVEPLGGNIPITSIVVFCIGLLGSLFGPWILNRCGIKDSMAQGFAMGATSHGIGTAKAIEMGAIQGAISGLAMALMGVATAIIVPIVEKYLY